MSGAVAPICPPRSASGLKYGEAERFCRVGMDVLSSMSEQEVNGDLEELLDLNEVMQGFGVAEWTNLGPLEGPQSELLRLLVEIQGQRYILKEQPEVLLGQETSHRYAFQQHLVSHGIPLAPLWLTPQGEPAVTVGEDAFELQAWIEGTLFDSADPHEQAWIEAAGEMLGRIHQASHRYRGPEYRWPSEVQAGGLTQGWLNLARAKAEQCEIHALAVALANLVDAWESALPAAMMALGTGRQLPEFHIHGDYSALNLRFNPAGVSEILGLEASRWEKRLIEVAYGVFYFAGLKWHADSNTTRPLVRRGLDPIRASLFLRRYSAIYPPVPGEATLLVDALMLVAPIITANGPLEDVFYSTSDPDNAESDSELLHEDVLERLTWATALPGWLTRVRRSFAEMW
jgi:Ser/Thr protein kinase RdoA (MazF antagonist)